MTGFTILSLPEWTDIQISDNFYVSFALIGKRIVHFTPAGRIGKHEIEQYITKRRDFIVEMGLAGEHIVQINDYSQLTGYSNEGRDVFVDFLLKEDRQGALLGYISYNGSVSIQIAIRVGKKILDVSSLMEHVRNYKEAVTQAVIRLSRVGHLDSSSITRNALRRTWTFSTKQFTSTANLLSDDILLISSKGQPETLHILLFFEFLRQVFIESGMAEREYHYRIDDWSELDVVEWRTRRRYVTELIRLNREFSCQSAIVIGLSSFLRAAVVTTRWLIPYPVEICDNLGEALAWIEQDRYKSADGEEKNRSDEAPAPKDILLQPQIDKLLHYIGTISWNPGDDSVPEWGEGIQEEFRPLFEAVSLAKDDFKAMLRERGRAEEDRQEKNKYNELRAEIWKIASDKDLSQRELIQKLLDLVGPAFGVSRACFNEFTNNKRKSRDLICAIEWCDRGVKSSLGTKIPNFLVKQFENSEIFHLNSEMAARYVPGPLRLIVKKMIEAITIPLNIESLAFLPYSIGDELEGWFTFDICYDNPHKPVLTENVKNVVMEMVEIVAQYNAYKRAQEELHRAYDSLEERVEERTAELAEANQKLRQEVKERQRVEKELLVAKEQAEAASVAKSRFLANMSHEIRTPLNAIIGFAEIILRSTNPEEIKKHVETILGESRLLLGLLNTVLDHAKLEAGKIGVEIESFDLVRMLGEVNRGFKLIAESKGLLYHFYVSPSLPRQVEGDPLRLRQVLSNLVSNSIKFTEKGKVSVHVKRVKEEGDTLTARFLVADTGPGIPKNKQTTIFDSFTQLDGSTTRSFGGTGLGTTIARQLVEMMGGRIGLISEEGRGCVFWFELPFKFDKGESTSRVLKQGAYLPSENINSKSAKVLLAEDYIPNQEVGRICLEGINHEVDVAENGREACALALNKRYDIIFMDIQMPLMDGYEAAINIRGDKDSKNKETPILGLTAHSGREERQKCLAAGMDEVLTKPLNHDILIETVTRWAGRSSVSSLKERKQISIWNGSAPIDLDLLIHEYEDDSLVERVLKRFINTLREQIRSMQNYIMNGEYKALMREAHAAKGGALTLESLPLVEAAKKLETAARQGKKKNVDIALQEFQSACEELDNFVQITYPE